MLCSESVEGCASWSTTRNTSSLRHRGPTGQGQTQSGQDSLKLRTQIPVHLGLGLRTANTVQQLGVPASQSSPRDVLPGNRRDLDRLGERSLNRSLTSHFSANLRGGRENRGLGVS
jgi:hypothetical protein